MTTRPTRTAQTSTEVKKLYKQNGPVPSERQQRQLERAADLEKRALSIREREERSKANKKKREEKGQKEATLRRMNGVSLATQMIGYSHTQAQLKRGMEAFLGYKKKSEQDRKKKELEVARQLEAVVEEAAKEPWDDDADDAFDTPEPSTRSGDQWMDDELDDDTLLEIHDQFMSDPVEEATETSQPPKIASSAPVAHSPSMGQSKEDVDFVRLHGPINKMIDSILHKLPEPLIELLSQDCSVDPTAWDPSPALLHKLNPPGLPPHRLRVKVGCAVTLLRDLNSSSQLSKSQHLQILRAEQERLECLVLDGQLEGTKTILTKVSFAAKHRNEDSFPFQRIQFPIQVSKDFATPVHSRKPSLSGFKKPTQSGRALQLSNSSSKRLMPTPKAPSQSNRNPSFKLPGLPASISKPTPISKPTLPPPAPAPALDGWDDFLDSASQIARDLSLEPSSPCMAPPDSKPPVVPATPTSNSLPPLSTQDFDFSLEDLDDSPVLPQVNFIYSDERSKKRAAPPLTQAQSSKTTPQPSKVMDTRSGQPMKIGVPAVSPHNQPVLKRKHPEDSDQAAVNFAPKKRTVAASARRDGPHQQKTMQSHSMGPKQVFNTAITKAASNTGARRDANNSQTMSRPSFSEFGLSTQEANSFFDDDDDDDDLAFGSPPIAVR
ncbi:hypothetical protein P171DRAFT_435885 [Karstenula rhodostoma CBS 690.94]|uniref:DNA helicase Pif1-like 2B domain-containing protein n=1 Tax=Karstenula rhodostoma CBS 690.94 TaxID=1392251 RepID=A0A9P4U8I2_9PLEO|nr:hypothetical protein P171DRAFT_435885 [Karstenula rhodostoma CBS 690.94]